MLTINYRAFFTPKPAFNFLWVADVRWLSKRKDGGHLMSASLSEVGWVPVLSIRDLGALGKKYREQREIEVTPAPALEADS